MFQVPQLLLGCTSGKLTRDTAPSRSHRRQNSRRASAPESHHIDDTCAIQLNNTTVQFAEPLALEANSEIERCRQQQDGAGREGPWPLRVWPRVRHRRGRRSAESSRHTATKGEGAARRSQCWEWRWQEGGDRGTDCWSRRETRTTTGDTTRGQIAVAQIRQTWAQVYRLV